jgi:hypothetical protein
MVGLVGDCAELLPPCPFQRSMRFTRMVKHYLQRRLFQTELAPRGFQGRLNGQGVTRWSSRHPVHVSQNAEIEPLS